MKKLSRFSRPLAFAVLGAALVSCSGVTPTSIVSGDENTVTVKLNQGLILSGYDVYGAQILAEQHCARYNKLLAAEYVVDENGSVSKARQHTYRCLEERQTARVASPSLDDFKTQCTSFGFTPNTDAHASCVMQLTVATQQGQSNNNAVQRIANSLEEQERQRNLDETIQLINQGVDYFNVNDRNSNSSNTVSCTRMGDFSGQIVTFSRSGCPVGYAPAL